MHTISYTIQYTMLICKIVYDVVYIIFNISGVSISFWMTLFIQHITCNIVCNVVCQSYYKVFSMYDMVYTFFKKHDIILIIIGFQTVLAISTYFSYTIQYTISNMISYARRILQVIRLFLPFVHTTQHMMSYVLVDVAYNTSLQCRY